MQSKGEGSAPVQQVLPFGMAWDCPAFERARALAVKLFDGHQASIVLFNEGRIWRSVDPEGKLAQHDAPSLHVLETGKPLWIEDMTTHPLTANNAWVTGRPFLRAYAGVPIVLWDKSVLGVFCVGGCQTKPEDPEMLARLQDLADFVADECERARQAMKLEEGGRALHATRSVLKAMIEVAPVSLMMTDRDMRLVEATGRWFASVGMTPDKAIGHVVYDLSPGFEQYREAYDRVLAGETIKSDKVLWRRNDGEERWLRSELIPWRDEQGAVAGLINVLLDITELTQALHRSEQAEQRMNLAAQIADLHVWEMDFLNQQLVLGGGMEKAQEELFGRRLTYEELYDNTNATIHPDDRARIAEAWDKAVAEDRPFVPEYRVNRDDGKEVWAACGVKLIRSKSGKPLRLIGAMQNITDRKKAEAALVQAKEEAEAANKAKSAFLATMSHEIRTPLNGVLGMAQAMNADELNDVQRERIEVIRQSGETLLAILNDVLDLSKIEAGKLELEEAEFDIDDVARGAHAAFTAIAQKKGLSFDLSVEPAARGVYRGDSTRLRQILYNLVSNALKFTEEGEVRVKVDRAGRDLLMTIRDTGIGIPQDRLARLFDKFEQADASTTRRYGGTGLGLSICRDLAELMGGKITVQSREGAGSVFAVEIPLTRMGDSVSSTSQREPGAETAIETAELRILAAEDNMVNQLVLKTLLHQAGLDPVIVSDGQKAVEAWRDGEWDVILMDVQMPVMDGPTATRMIREEEAARGRARTPIVALTANAMSHQVAEYKACGMDDFVAKPIEISALFGALERVLSETEAQVRKAS